MSYSWVPLERLNGLKWYSREIPPCIQNPSDRVLHFISVQQ